LQEKYDDPDKLIAKLKRKIARRRQATRPRP
jgi:hypothetical protein